MTCLEVLITIPEVYVKMSRDNIKTTRLIYSIFSKITIKCTKTISVCYSEHVFFLLCHLKQHFVNIGNFKQVIIVCFLEINFHLFWRYYLVFKNKKTSLHCIFMSDFLISSGYIFITSDFLKALFHTFYLVHSWMLCPKCSLNR